MDDTNNNTTVGGGADPSTSQPNQGQSVADSSMPPAEDALPSAPQEESTSTQPTSGMEEDQGGTPPTEDVTGGTPPSEQEDAVLDSKTPIPAGDQDEQDEQDEGETPPGTQSSGNLA